VRLEESVRNSVPYVWDDEGFLIYIARQVYPGIQFNKLVVVVFPMFCALLFREAVRVITHVISGYNVRHPKLTDAS